MQIVSFGQLVVPTDGKPELTWQIVVRVKGITSVITTDEKTVGQLLELVSLSSMREQFTAETPREPPPPADTAYADSDDVSSIFGDSAPEPVLGVVSSEEAVAKPSSGGLGNGKATPVRRPMVDKDGFALPVRSRTVEKDEMGYPIVERRASVPAEVIDEDGTQI